VSDQASVLSGGHLCNSTGGAQRADEEGLCGLLHIRRQNVRNAQGGGTALQRIHSRIWGKLSPLRSKYSTIDLKFGVSKIRF